MRNVLSLFSLMILSGCLETPVQSVLEDRRGVRNGQPDAGCFPALEEGYPESIGCEHTGEGIVPVFDSGTSSRRDSGYFDPYGEDGSVEFFDSGVFQSSDSGTSPRRDSGYFDPYGEDGSVEFFDSGIPNESDSAVVDAGNHQY